MKRNAPAFLSCGLRVGGEERPGILGNAGKARLVRDDKLPGIGGVEQVFAELLAQHGEPFADDFDACALGFGQLGAREAEVAEFTLDDAASDGRERGEAVGGLHCLVLGEERLVLRQIDEELRDGGKRGIVGVSQRRRVDDALQVADDAPAAREGECRLFERFGDGLPRGGCFGCRDACERLLKILRERLDGGGHVLGTDGGVVDQARRIEQGIDGFGHGGASPCHQRPRRRSTASTVLVISMAIVMGPTPPGTGVMADATSRTFS